MPDGLLQWYDERAGKGRVVRGGREYPVRAADMEPRARVPGARVHFDVRKDERGVPIAVDVKLREGTRVSHRQRRFGEMAGARRPDTRGTAPFTHPHPEMGRRLAVRPMEVARGWAERMAGNDIDAAALYYAPDITLHAGDEDLHAGLARGWLSTSGLPGRMQSIEIEGDGELVMLRWLGPDRRPARSWIRTEHGEIVEQWVAGAVPPADLRAEPPEEPAEGATFEVVTEGEEAEAAEARAVAKVRRVLGLVDEPVLHVRIKLSMAPNPAVERPARAKATVDVNGQYVRGDVAGYTMTEAVDLLEERLQDQLQHRSERQQYLRQVPPTPEPGQWRRGQATPPRPERYDRPPEEREIVAQKTLALGELTVDEAVFDMDMLDYDFYLFRELATGADAVLQRDPGGHYRLRRLNPSSNEAPVASVEVEVEPEGAPSLSVQEALELLDMGDERFVFFSDKETGRGTVVYYRYDGHYGLIIPDDVEEPAP